MSLWYCEEDNLLKHIWFNGHQDAIMDLTGPVWLPFKRKNSFAGRKWIYIGEL